MNNKRDKKGRFAKARKFFKKVKLLTIAFIAYKYFEPALQVVWDQAITPHLAQLIQ